MASRYTKRIIIEKKINEFRTILGQGALSFYHSENKFTPKVLSLSWHASRPKVFLTGLKRGFKEVRSRATKRPKTINAKNPKQTELLVKLSN